MANKQNCIKLFITTDPYIHGHDVVELSNHNGDTFTSKSEEFNDFISRSEVCEHVWIRTTRNRKPIFKCCKCNIFVDKKPPKIITHEVAHEAINKENIKLEEVINTLKKLSIRQEIYTNEEAMVFLKSCKRSLQKWRSEGILPHALIGGHLLYTHDNLMEFLENHTKHSKRNIPNDDEIAIAAIRYAGLDNVSEKRSFFDGASWIISKLGYDNKSGQK